LNLSHQLAGTRTAGAIRTRIQKMKSQLKDRLEERNEKALLLGLPSLEDEDVFGRDKPPTGISERDFMKINTYFEYLRAKEEYQILEEEVLRVIKHCEDDIGLIQTCTIDSSFYEYTSALNSILNKRNQFLYKLKRKLQC
jgi:hypothetical protein